MSQLPNGPLTGYNVLELGSSVAGPFCGRILADFGAEVIKVEPPEGDAVRTMSKRVNGRSLYAASIFRNKQLIALDLRTAEGRSIVREIVRKCDVLLENFRPGTMEKWGLGYEELSRINPSLVMVRISGFGQSGPYSQRAGYGVIGEAMSGLRHLTGDPERPPGRINASVTDEITGIYGALGAMMALLARQRTGRGQWVDAALYESAFSLIEPHIPVYGKLGISANRSGSRLPDSTPNNLYPTKDGNYIHITAMADPIFRRLAEIMGRPELKSDERFRTAVARSQHHQDVDEIITLWTRSMNISEIEVQLNEANVPASRIYTVEDIFRDPHYRARNMLVELQDNELGSITVTGVVPELSDTPGRIRHAGGRVGRDTREVLIKMAGLSEDEIDDLSQRKIIFCDESAHHDTQSVSAG